MKVLLVGTQTPSGRIGVAIRIRAPALSADALVQTVCSGEGELLQTNAIIINSNGALFIESADGFFEGAFAHAEL